MTGQLFFAAGDSRRGKHEHVTLRLDDGRELRFRDTRKFGRLFLTQTPETILDKIGPERQGLVREIFRNLVTSLILEERVRTSLVRAKAARSAAEKIITRGRKDTVHARRLVAGSVYGSKAVKKVFDERGIEIPFPHVTLYMGEGENTGVLAVELFELSDGSVVVNELAMRPHNSGHWTIDGAATSQFENHLRAVLDLPLGAPHAVAPYTVMVNVLGGDLPDLHRALRHVLARDPDLRVHLYGKAVRPGRKIGLRINPGLGVSYGDNPKLEYAGARTTKFGIYRDRFDEALELEQQLAEQRPESLPQTAHAEDDDPLPTGDEVRFEDLFDLEDIQRLQDEFAAATGVASIITRPQPCVSIRGSSSSGRSKKAGWRTSSTRSRSWAIRSSPTPATAPTASARAARPSG